VSYGAAAFDNFGGLDLRSSPDASGCIDMENVDLSRPGMVRSRDGYTVFNDTAEDRPWNRLAAFPRTGGNAQLMAGRAVAAGGGEVAAFGSDGTQVAAQATTQSVFDFARLGTPTAEYVYIANSPQPTRRWDGTTFTAPAGMPIAKHVAVQPNDNRLVAAGITAGGAFLGGASRLYFSDPDLPESWPVDGSGNAVNSVDLGQGDGEEVQGLIAWRDLLFAFKPSRFFVFYGNGVTNTGVIDFNKRSVDTGVGMSVPGAVAAMTDGVYFLHASGVYRTTGGTPERISTPLDPYFRGEATSFFNVPALNRECLMPSHNVWARLAAHEERLHVNLYAPGAGKSFRTFVYDPATGQWAPWTLDAWPAASMPQYDLSGVLARPALVFGSYATSKLLKLTGDATDDDGTAIASRYRSGFFNLGKDAEKRIAGTRLWGIGSPSFAISKNYGDLTTPLPLTLGTAPDIATAMDHQASKGINHSYGLSGDAPWAVHQVVHMVDGDRPPSKRGD
jgi:hypothetical protein